LPLFGTLPTDLLPMVPSQGLAELEMYGLLPSQVRSPRP
jgi:hypothetical protein